MTKDLRSKRKAEREEAGGLEGSEHKFCKGIEGHVGRCVRVHRSAYDTMGAVCAFGGCRSGEGAAVGPCHDPPRPV